MIIGELDLDRAQRDPAYLARIKAFLVPGDQGNVRLLPGPAASPAPPATMTRTALVQAADDILERLDRGTEYPQACQIIS
jgi:hypothetical protein